MGGVGELLQVMIGPGSRIRGHDGNHGCQVKCRKIIA